MRVAGSLQSRLAWGVLLLVGLRTAWLLASSWSFTTDDAYITLRYARHLATGHGIVWTPGDPLPVEGYSNFLYVLLAAAAFALGLDAIILLKLVSCAALFATLLVLYRLARQWVGPLLATLPPLLLTAFSGALSWTVSGLETASFQLCVVGATAAWVAGVRGAETGAHDRVLRRSQLVLSAVLSLLAALLRPEGPIVAVVLLAATVVHLRQDHALTRGAATTTRSGTLLKELRTLGVSFGLAFLLPYSIYFGWRLHTFGRLLPNSVYCKAAWSGNPSALLHDFWQAAQVFIVVALLQDPSRLRASHLPLALIPIVYAVILYGADPIVGHELRHFLAALPLVLVAAVVAIDGIRARLSESLGWPRLVTIGGILPGVTLALGLLWVGARTPELAGKLASQAKRYASRMQARATVGRYLDERLRPDQSYVIGDTGLVPFLVRARALDVFCLNSREMTEPPISFDQHRFIDWLFAERPEVIVVHSRNPWRLDPRPEYGFYPALASDPRLVAGYSLERVFGAKGDDFFYWVFARASDRV